MCRGLSLQLKQVYKRKVIMSKEQIDRILKTDFSLIDNTIDAKINSIDEMTGKLSQRSNFLAQFQLLLQNELGSIKNVTQTPSINENIIETEKISTKQQSRMYCQIKEESPIFQISRHNQPLNQQDQIQLDKQSEQKMSSNWIESNSENKINEFQASSQRKPDQKTIEKNYIIEQFNAVKIEVQEFKLLLTFLKEEIKSEVQYFKSITVENLSHSFKQFQLRVQNQYQKQITTLELQIASLKQENKKIAQSFNPLKEITFQKYNQEKENSFNITRKLKQFSMNNYNSPTPKDGPSHEIINSEEWKTYRLHINDNYQNKTEIPVIKEKVFENQPYSVPATKTITVGIPPIKNGFGVLKSGNEVIYRGMWKDGKFDGSGKLNWEGYCYQGNFSNGCFEGHGRLQIKDVVFVGKFKANKASGQGTLEVGKKRIMGIWQKSQMIRMF